jgi:hypothetical protein
MILGGITSLGNGELAWIGLGAVGFYLLAHTARRVIDIGIERLHHQSTLDQPRQHTWPGMVTPAADVADEPGAYYLSDDDARNDDLAHYALDEPLPLPDMTQYPIQGGDLESPAQSSFPRHAAPESEPDATEVISPVVDDEALETVTTVSGTTQGGAA